MTYPHSLTLNDNDREDFLFVYSDEIGRVTDRRWPNIPLALICLIALPIAIVIGVLFAPFYLCVKDAHGRIDGGVK